MKLRTLWGLMLGGPLLWLAYLETNYALVPWACGTGHQFVLVLASVLAFVGTTVMGAMAWTKWRTAGGRDATDAPAPRGRTAFMTMSGIGLGFFSSLVLLASTIPIFVLSACD